MDLGIKGRRAIVTGGGSGIGFETARLFLEEGVRVLIAGRTADKIDKARDELAKKTGGEVHAVQADMTREADINREGKIRRRGYSDQQRRHDVFRALRGARRQ
jgi:3-oxoacyl-[acyl-carrier protein] reductase